MASAVSRSRISVSSVSLGVGPAAASRWIRIRVNSFTTQKITSPTIRNWMTAFMNRPTFTVATPAFRASASVA